MASKTKDLLMDFVRIDSTSKVKKRTLSNASKESSFGRMSNSGGKNKKQPGNKSAAFD